MCRVHSHVKVMRHVTRYVCLSIIRRYFVCSSSHFDYIVYGRYYDNLITSYAFGRCQSYLTRNRINFLIYLINLRLNLEILKTRIIDLGEVCVSYQLHGYSRMFHGRLLLGSVISQSVDR